MLAHINPPGAITALLERLDSASTQEEEIHTVYALRSITESWNEPQRERVVDWFDRGRTLRGAASMTGYVELLFEDVLEILPEAEREAAVARRDALRRERSRRAAVLLERAEEDKPDDQPDLAQMSFDEVAEYLEYDVMAYERYSPEQGELIFRRAGCADCHVFGSIGTGGGPDLSTVVKRFRRREILESIVYPSRVISDQYTSLDVTLRDGEMHSGMVIAENDRRLILISSRGERIRLRKSNIVAREPSSISIMPEGLLDAMDMVDLVNLMRFLDEAAEDQ